MPGRAYFILVERIPPELRCLDLACRVDHRLPSIRRKLLVVALERGRVDIAAIVPERPPEAEEGVGVAHTADVAPFDLLLGLELLADLNQVGPGLWQVGLGNEIGSIEEDPGGRRHRNRRRLVT